MLFTTNLTKRQQTIQELVLKSSPEGVYQMVLDGTLERFPIGFWSMPECYDYGIACTKYLIEEVLKWDIHDVKAKLNADVFHKNKLRGMITKLYHNSTYDAINSAYPNTYKPWDIFCPNKYWTEQTMKDALRWLYTEKYSYNEDFIKSSYCASFLKKEGLNQLSHQPLFELLDYVFPGRFKPWELVRTPQSYWSDETKVEAVRWLYTEKYKWDRQYVLNTYCTDFLRKEGLSSICRGSIIPIILQAFPNEGFREWEFLQVPKSFWNVDKAVEALRWLYTEKYAWDPIFVRQTYSYQFICDSGLASITLLGYTQFELLDRAFPNTFKSSEFCVHNKS